MAKQYRTYKIQKAGPSSIGIEPDEQNRSLQMLGFTESFGVRSRIVDGAPKAADASGSGILENVPSQDKVVAIHYFMSYSMGRVGGSPYDVIRFKHHDYLSTPIVQSRNFSPKQFFKRLNVTFSLGSICE